MGLSVVPGLGGGDEPFVLHVTSIADVVLFVCGYHFVAFSYVQLNTKTFEATGVYLHFPLYLVAELNLTIWASLGVVVGVSRSLT